MVRFAIRRILQGVLTLFLMITAIFFFVQIIMPGDFVSNFVLGLSPAQAAEWRMQLGLDQPLWQQYVKWVRNLLTLDLGRSFYGYRVADGIQSSAPRTILVFVTGLTLAFLIGQWLGRVTAWRGPGFLSDSVTLTAIVFYAFFPPALAFFLKMFFQKVVVIYPPSTDPFWLRVEEAFTMPPDAVISRMTTLLGVVILGLIVVNVVAGWLHRRIPPLANLLLVIVGWVVSWLIAGIGQMALWTLHSALIPILAFICLSTGEMLVLTRTSMNDTLHEQYVHTARAKGLPERVVRDRHAARNAMLPILSKLVISLPYLLGGLAIIEHAVEWPGMGAYLFYSTQQQDMPTILGYMLLIGVLALVSRLILEFLYAFLDPRIRFASGSRS